MGKKKGEENPNPSELKEGHHLLGVPTFELLENGRFKCVETGHELPPHARDSYAESKHCRLGLIDAALGRNKPPLNMFKQDPSSRSKLVCRLTGDTINKMEEHIWKHINGKRFLNKLDKKEAEKETPNKKTEKQEEKKKKKNIENGCLQKNKKKIEAEGDNIDDIINGVSDLGHLAAKVTDSEDAADFWMPNVGERWDHDDGGDRWDSDSESRSDTEDDGEEDMEAEEAKLETPKMSKRKRQMSSETVSRKKKMEAEEEEEVA